jgi:hypothetical protein
MTQSVKRQVYILLLSAHILEIGKNNNKNDNSVTNNLESIQNI